MGRIIVIIFFTSQAIFCQVDHIDTSTLPNIRTLLKEDIYEQVDQPLPSFEFFSHGGTWIYSDSLAHDHTLIFLWHWSC